MFPTKVLLAIDGSPESTHAARMAVELSSRLSSELHVVRVGDIPSVYSAPEWGSFDPDFQGRLFARAESETREKLEEQIQKIKEAGGKVRGTYARVGTPDVEIVRLAEELEAGLVVLGSRGFGPLRRAMMGSVSSSVVRHAHCPVLVVRGGGSSGNSSYLPGRILLAFDGSKEALVASQAAIEIARGTSSELHILYVLPAVPQSPYSYPLSKEKSETSLERAKQGARSLVSEQAERMEATGVVVAGVHLALGRPEEEIVELSEELDTVMVVMGSRGLGGVRRALLGSVSEFVVHYAGCPVLVVRREDMP